MLLTSRPPEDSPSDVESANFPLAFLREWLTGDGGDASESEAESLHEMPSSTVSDLCDCLLMSVGDVTAFLRDGDLVSPPSPG